MDSVSAVIDKCNHKMIEKNIAKKSSGQKYVSGIVRTKAKAAGVQKPQSGKGQAKALNTVYPGRGNSSPIGKHEADVPHAVSVATAKRQSHPGTNNHLRKQDMKFCDVCGVYKKGKCTLAVCHFFYVHSAFAVVLSDLL
jgi:hypothetical protein